jgi:hypothetical protein
MARDKYAGIVEILSVEPPLDGHDPAKLLGVVGQRQTIAFRIDYDRLVQG